MVKKDKRLSLTNLILLLLEKSVEGGELFFDSMNDLRSWIYEAYGDYPRPVKNMMLSQAIKRLREKGLIEKDYQEVGRIVIRLTKAGKDFLLLKKDDKEVDWDGKWRIVVFDIPESKRLVRDVLRSRLRNWGFVPWQKSVWASKKNLTSQLRKLIKELEIEEWVMVIESNNVGIK